MENRFLCRGKRLDNGEWVEGYLIADETDDTRYFIGYVMRTNEDSTPHDLDVVQVDPSTICRCAGLKDKNGALIWEHDILHNGNYFVVKWNAPCARFDIVLNDSHNIPMGKWEPMICDWKTNDFKDYRKAVDYEIIGNIFDNPELFPELLESEEEYDRE